MRLAGERGMESLPSGAPGYTYLVLFLTIAAAQLAMIVPLVPVLLSIGALAGHGLINPFVAMLAIVSGLILADLVWYHVGRWRGARVLALACRLALEPDECIRRAENLFVRHGARLLVGVRFVPGLLTAALPLAGLFRMHRRRFLLYDGLGASLWTAVYVGVGLALAEPLGAVGGAVARLGPPALGIVAGALVAYIGVRYVRRQRFLRQLRVARIRPEELRRRLDAGEPIVIVDLRHPIDFEADPHVVPGALYIPAEDLPQRHREIPRRRDVVLYCT